MKLFVLSFIVAIWGAKFAVAEDATCLAACSDWSVVLGYCRGIYGDTPQNSGYEYANDFVACLCEGQESTGAIGNDTIAAAAGVCESCATTPSEIQDNLSTFLTLCTVQISNGTAANATIFAPLSYTTSEDTSAVGLISLGHPTASFSLSTAPTILFVALCALVAFR